MKAKLISVIVVAAVAVGFCLTCLMVVNHVTGRVEALSMEAQHLVDEGRMEEAVAEMVRLADVWEKYQPFLEMLISHDEMHAVVEKYTEASINLRRGHLDDYFKSMSLLEEMLEHIREQERVRWGNIL